MDKKNKSSVGSTQKTRYESSKNAEKIKPRGNSLAISGKGGIIVSKVMLARAEICATFDGLQVARSRSPGSPSKRSNSERGFEQNRVHVNLRAKSEKEERKSMKKKLLAGILAHPDFPRLMADLEIYVNGTALKQAQGCKRHSGHDERNCYKKA